MENDSVNDESFDNSLTEEELEAPLLKYESLKTNSLQEASKSGGFSCIFVSKNHIVSIHLILVPRHFYGVSCAF